MGWTVTYLEHEMTVETAYSGAMTLEELREAIVATVAAGKVRGAKRFLSDCTRLDAPGNLVDIYDLPAVYEALGAGTDWWEAVVLPQMPDVENGMRFYETVTRNRGLQVRVFPSREDAFRWLRTFEARGPKPA
jgi:hypothetical protein